MEVRIVAQIAACMDDISQADSKVVVIGATSRPETIDSALRRAGRFEREVTLGVPNEKERIEILRILTKKMRLQGNKSFPFESLVKLTPGYVGADLQTLCKEASISAVQRILGQDDGDIENLEDFFIEVRDFEKAQKKVQPSA